MRYPSFREVLGLSAVVRSILVLYSDYHDAHSTVKYTDVDYRVFTDAAWFLLNPMKDGKHTAQGPLGQHFGDPYLRDTYRYTPLLALLMTPNEFLLPSFGKLLFSLCDLLVGSMLYNLFCTFPPIAYRNATEVQRRATLWVSMLWLLNPLVFSISTRGSSESILGLLVVGTLFLAMKCHYRLAALLLGLSVHWKIYPVIYGASLLASIGATTHYKKPKGWLAGIASPQGINFAVMSAGAFGCITGALYLIWGYPLLWNSYLYHLGRLDHRHNFSPYFYATYLSYPSLANLGSGSSSTLTSNPLLSFIPQMSLAFGAGFLFGRNISDLPFTWFIQTMIFVTFNKVCTSQYFIWYMWFLPLILPRLHLSIREGIILTGAWAGSQALWLSIAYRLEFLGEQVFFPLWLAGVVFLITNCWVLVRIMTLYVRR